MKKVIIVAVFVAALLLAALYAPLAIYTTENGCPTNPPPQVRLHMIKGDSIDKMKEGDIPTTNPVEGCAPNTKYTLYLL